MTTGVRCVACRTWLPKESWNVFFNFYFLLDDNYVTHGIARRLAHESSIGSPAASTPEPPMMLTPIPVAVKSNPLPMNNLGDLSLKHGEEYTFCLVCLCD